jgi:hypothetical protein
MVAALSTPQQEHKTSFVDSIILNPDTTMVIGNIGGEARSIHSIVSTLIPKCNRFGRGFAVTQFTAIPNALFNINEVGMGIFKTITEGKKHRLDNALELTMNVGQLGEDVSTIALTISEFRPLITCLSWATPLSIASAVISVVNYVINGRNIYWSRKIIKQLKKDPLKKVYKEHRYHLEKQCGVDPKIVRKAIRSGNQVEAIKHIQHRIRAKTACHSLSLIIATISILATIIFLTMTATPLLLAGSALLATLFALGIIKKCVDYFSNSRLERSINKITLQA